MCYQLTLSFVLCFYARTLSPPPVRVFLLGEPMRLTTATFLKPSPFAAGLLYGAYLAPVPDPLLDSFAERVSGTCPACFREDEPVCSPNVLNWAVETTPFSRTRSKQSCIPTLDPTAAASGLLVAVGCPLFHSSSNKRSCDCQDGLVQLGSLNNCYTNDQTCCWFASGGSGCASSTSMVPLSLLHTLALPPFCSLRKLLSACSSSSSFCYCFPCQYSAVSCCVRAIPPLFYTLSLMLMSSAVSFSIFH